MEFKFKQDHPNPENRRKECEKIRQQFADKLPIICEKDPKCKLSDIDKTKYLVPNDLTVAQFTFMIRKRLELPKEAAFYLLVGGKHSIVGERPLNDIYENYKDSEDGFLYIAYSSEVTWGK